MNNTLLLYKQVKVLNRDEHKGLRLRQANDCAFAAGTHLVPLAAQEFHQAARHYPIVFVGEGDNSAPVCLLGLSAGRNNFVDEEGRWSPHLYIPAFIRRYPFVLAQSGAENFTVCIDAKYPGWNEQEGSALFSEDGGNSEYLDGIIQFLQNFTVEMQRTQRFVARLDELGLLVARELRLSRPEGESFVLQDFRAVDEDKFAKLSGKNVLALHKDGYLGWIYAHLMSLGNANQLFERYLSTKKPD